MYDVWQAWLEFAACVLLIAYGGTKLSRYGDVIAEKTGLGGTWVGLALLATVTSLPELITGISSVTVAGVPEIAVGDALGSCVFNLLILVVVDLLVSGESVYTRVKQGHILSAGFGVLLIGFVGFTLLTADQLGQLKIGHVGASTPIIVLFYGLAMRVAFRYERQEQERYVEEAAERYPDIPLRQAAVRYALAAVVVIGAGVWLPFVGAFLSQVMGWHQTFVGTLFVASATSAPELVSTIAAVRIGALDMAVANLLGSNLFDIAIIAVDDLCFAEGPILSKVSKIHVVTALSAVMMNGVAIIGLFYRPKGRVFKLVGWASLLLFSIYLMNLYVINLYDK
jgi:cation:H+ antiporter